MPYTLAKAFVWLVLAGVLGIAIGWLLRSVAAHRQISRARGGDQRDVDALTARVAELEAALAAQHQGEMPARHGGDRPEPPGGGADASDPPAEPAAGRIADRDTCAAGLGIAIEQDDLKVIEGIGPSIEELCYGIGIRTWADMAGTEPSLLRTMLTDAGPRFKMHDPSEWPRQAELLVDGRWHEFGELVAELRGGVTSN